ncbi:MAG: hypothetical protein RLZZ519_2100 [Bacteroidota bacterium]
MPKFLLTLALTFTLALTPCEALPQSPCEWFATPFSIDEWNAVAAHPSLAIEAIQQAIVDCPDRLAVAAEWAGYLKNAMQDERNHWVDHPNALADSLAYHVYSAANPWSSANWNAAWKEGQFALADQHWAAKTEYELDWAEDFGYGLGLLQYDGQHLFMDHQGHRYPAAFSMASIQTLTEAVYISSRLPITHSKANAAFPNVKLLIVDAEALPNIFVTAAQFPGLETLIIHGLEASDRGQEKPLPVTLPAIPSLRKLVIARAQPLNLPAALVEMPDLRILQLIRTKTERLPAEIGRCLQLEELIFEGGGKGRLPGSVEDLLKLRRLSLAEGGMTEFPDVIFKLDSLVALDLSRNAFGTLPKEISKLKHLRWLNLRWAQLSEIPAELFALDQLEYLNLCENAFESWPIGTATLPHLKELDLHNNHHSSLNLSSKQFPALRKLNLSDSYTTMAPEAFAQLTQIQILDLSDLVIDELPDELKKLKQLQFLILKTNNNPRAEVVIEDNRKQIAKWIPGCKVMLR